MKCPSVANLPYARKKSRCTGAKEFTANKMHRHTVCHNIKCNYTHSSRESNAKKKTAIERKMADESLFGGMTEIVLFQSKKLNELDNGSAESLLVRDCNAVAMSAADTWHIECEALQT
jgi:hypothetical protein